MGRLKNIISKVWEEATKPTSHIKGDDFFGDVQCFFPDQSYLLNLKKGQRVNVLGYCDGLFMNIILQNCIIK